MKVFLEATKICNSLKGKDKLRIEKMNMFLDCLISNQQTVMKDTDILELSNS